ncbi:MAG: ABC transporter ATP-binding protein [Nitrospiraceae bacterium]|nr:MAG: ABC transporter ATP-binding protein [Nitrospiraceae bacterium]
MRDIVIKIENLYKEYRLGTLGSGTLHKDLQSWWAKARGKEDPNSMVITAAGQKRDINERFWALQDITLDVQQGEILGIIGANGAGKSTLLKILSRVTAPTKGTVKVRGRIASLLEVGTGFHPELTGKENVYLNGAILGMTKNEVDRKFTEIVEFAEVEKFIDTPVKRYSSGMYVRLAFAVAAHLEPEILIVDEVLAVGDARFQKKCLGKMEDVGKQGRTILFVSHNMPMIASLCSRAVLLDQGRLIGQGPTTEIIQTYFSRGRISKGEADFSQAARKPGDDTAHLLAARLKNKRGQVTTEFSIDEEIIIEMEYQVIREGARINPNIHINMADGTKAFVASDAVIDNEAILKTKPGRYLARCRIPGNFLNDGTYYIGTALSTMETSKVHFNEKDLLQLTVVDPIEGTVTRGRYVGAIPGIIRPALEWESENLA